MNNQDPSIQKADFLLLPQGSTNEQFDKNLLFFKEYQINLFNRISSHTCKDYQICLNPDESINIYKNNTKSVLYPSNKEACHRYTDSLLSAMQFSLQQCTHFLGINDESIELSLNHPLHANLMRKLADTSGLSSLLNNKNEPSFIRKEKINFLPLLRVFGIGTGEHLIKAINKYDIACLIIHEPHFDLFYLSLFTSPWNEIFSFFDNDPNRDILLCLEGDKDAFTQEKALLETLHPFVFHSKATLFGLFECNFQNLIQRENSYDEANVLSHAAGWYEDQVVGLSNSIKNIIANNYFFNGKQASPFRVFLVGSGPSLNDSISYIKQHQENAIIMACGSAITALINHGITPDIHILQERTWTKEIMLKYASEENYKNIIAFKLNVVETSLDSLYKDIFVFQKGVDPGSCFFDEVQHPVSYLVNPTVTNSGVSFSISMGADEVYMFGIDYGSTLDNDFIHAEGTIINKDDKTNTASQFTLNGIYSETIYTDEYMKWSHTITEQAIRAKPDIKWVNIGDGALIRGTQNIKADKLPKILKGNINKKNVLNDIKCCFDNNYNSDTITNDLNNVHLNTSSEYLNTLLSCFDSIPSTRSGIVKNISIISHAALIGQNESTYLPQKLFGPEIIRYLDAVYTQVAISQSDDEAIDFYLKSIDILKLHAEDIFMDFQKVVFQSLDTGHA